MPTPVKVRLWRAPEDSLPLNELDWTMFELPGSGDRYWHGTDGFTVREVDETGDPPIVNLVYDFGWMDEVSSRLPDGYIMDGGRSTDTGQWHFRAMPPGFGRWRDPTLGDELGATLEQAIANAGESGN